MEYTSLNVPNLPTPKKVGYIFQGWYFDADYVQPYSEDSLYMKMSDVTLFAKWTEEKIVNNGIYGIDCDFTVVEDSVILSDYAKEHGYGLVKDYLVDGELYMEKADDGLFLRFQYDSGYQSMYSMFTFNIAQESGSKFRLASEKTIQIASESKRTYYIDWKNNKINEPLYLSVVYYDVLSELEGVDVSTTTTYYTMRVDIKEFYGFEQSYVKLKTTMDDGWYQTRVYYTKEDGNETAMSTYYATYVYLHLVDGNYNKWNEF